MASEGGTFVSATGGTFETAMPGTFVSAAGGTFETVMPGTFHSATGGTFETVMPGTFHSATGGTFETVLGGTIKPLPSLKDHYACNLKLLLNDRDWGIEDDLQLLPRYQYMYYNGSHVDVFVCRGKQESKDLESIFLNQFYKKYRALPVGNGARSF